MPKPKPLRSADANCCRSRIFFSMINFLTWNGWTRSNSTGDISQIKHRRWIWFLNSVQNRNASGKSETESYGKRASFPWSVGRWLCRMHTNKYDWWGLDRRHPGSQCAWSFHRSGTRGKRFRAWPRATVCWVGVESLTATHWGNNFPESTIGWSLSDSKQHTWVYWDYTTNYRSRCVATFSPVGNKIFWFVLYT